MKKFMTLMVAAGLVIGASTFAFGQDEKQDEKKDMKKKKKKKKTEGEEKK